MSDETQDRTSQPQTVAVVQPVVTARPNDLVYGQVTNSTFGERRRKATAGRKAVAAGEAEDKAVSRATARRK